jgi:hypothetical protein
VKRGCKTVTYYLEKVRNEERERLRLVLEMDNELERKFSVSEICGRANVG